MRSSKRTWNLYKQSKTLFDRLMDIALTEFGDGWGTLKGINDERQSKLNRLIEKSWVRGEGRYKKVLESRGRDASAWHGGMGK